MLCRRTPSSLVAHAPAKLNLFLRVLGKRADGYHEIETVMIAVDLYDTLIFSPASGGAVDLTVRQAGPAALPIPTGSENLVVRAALLLKSEAGVAHGARITLIKRIPPAAGLGGGSSDAAATLDGLNRFWSVGMDRHALCDLAGRLGSDVPFFLGPTSAAVCRGRGEVIEPLRLPSGWTFVVARPSSGLSTPAVYRECRPEPGGDGAGELCEALRGGRLDLAGRRLRNDLQKPAERLNRDVVRLSQLFSAEPVWGHQLSGSGTAYFGLCSSRGQGFAVAGRLRSRGVPWVTVVQSRC